MRFPSDPEGYFGLTRVVEPGLAVFKQAQIIAAKALGQVDLKGEFEPIIAVEPILRAPGFEPSLLYLMRVKNPKLKADQSWLRIVDVLRLLPAGPVRVAYNKAMQVFAGALEEELNVLELDAEVQARLESLLVESEEHSSK